MQLLEDSGREVLSYHKPEQTAATYSGIELMGIYQTGWMENNGTTAYIGTVSNEENEYTYVLYFPVNISKVTMYLNGERFTGGKRVLLPIITLLFLFILAAGVLYGLFTVIAMKRLTTAVQEISVRSYLPLHELGVFHDLYDSLNTLDTEIRDSDQLRAQTETMHKEWIANITHDLKTPLSPIKGYAELLGERSEKSVICDNTIIVHIRHLREKIEEDPSTPKKFLTVKGLEYRFIGE